MITLIQNFICTKQARLEYLKNDIPAVANYFKDYEFIVNYNSDVNYAEVKEAYESNVSKLKFYNNLEKDWGKTTLELIEQATTDYVFIMPEDFMCVHTDPYFFKKAINEAKELNCDYFLMHRIGRYASKRLVDANYSTHEFIYTCKWKSYPGSCISSVAIYKKEFITELLKYYTVANRRNSFSIAIPNNFEQFYFKGSYHIKGALKGEPAFTCAIPKEEIVRHHEPAGDLKQR